MSDEIKEILDRLKRIDHKEYSCGFEFADSSSFEEMCRCFEERKILADYITNLQQRIAYLERSNNRREDEILSLRDENVEIELLKQENERLKETIKKDNHILGCNFASKVKYKKKYEDYKSRVEKAIEYSKGNIQALENRLSTPFCNFEKATKELSIHQNYLELLQGGKDDNN